MVGQGFGAGDLLDLEAHALAAKNQGAKRLPVDQNRDGQDGIFEDGFRWNDLGIPVPNGAGGGMVALQIGMDLEGTLFSC